MSVRVLSIIVVVASIGGVGCATAGGHVPQPFPKAPRALTRERVAAASIAPAAPDGGVQGLISTALGLRGTPYRNGGSDPNGFDCSGFTQYVYAQYRVALPREVKDQFRVGNPIDVDELAAGDLLFFATTDAGPSHVAIAVGEDQFVHAPSTNGVVRIERLSSSYWATRYLGARRVMQP
jgi:cell wall-associated NlpC family hydrolase